MRGEGRGGEVAGRGRTTQGHRAPARRRAAAADRGQRLQVRVAAHDVPSGAVLPSSSWLSITVSALPRRRNMVANGAATAVAHTCCAARAVALPDPRRQRSQYTTRAAHETQARQTRSCRCTVWRTVTHETRHDGSMPDAGIRIVRPCATTSPGPGSPHTRVAATTASHAHVPLHSQDAV